MMDQKDTWFGNIPEGWSLSRVKFLLVNGENGIRIGPFGSALKGKTAASGPVKIYNQANVIANNFDLSRHFLSAENYEELQSYVILPGDILFSMMGTIGKCCIMPNNKPLGIMDSHLLKARLNEKIMPQYFVYAYDRDYNEAAYKQLLYMSQGSIMNGLNSSIVKQLKVPVPPVIQQNKIIGFLNSKCKIVDEAISRHQSIIEKLSEYQSSLITHAVLYGIHPDQKYQAVDSEWIDKIPNTWDMKRGKWLFREASERSEDGTEELLTVSQYTGVTPRSQKNVTMFEAESLVGYKICHIGDIAANTMWLWAGAIGVSNYEGVISPSYNVYRQIADAYDSEYLDYLLRAIPLVQHYKALSTGIRPSRLRLYPPQFLNIKFPVPPKTEQTAIVAYLKEKITGVTTAIARQKAAIEKLEQYKKSIIFNAVTGKIDVSGNES